MASKQLTANQVKHLALLTDVYKRDRWTLSTMKTLDKLVALGLAECLVEVPGAINSYRTWRLTPAGVAAKAEAAHASPVAPKLTPAQKTALSALPTEGALYTLEADLLRMFAKLAALGLAETVKTTDMWGNTFSAWALTAKGKAAKVGAA